MMLCDYALEVLSKNRIRANKVWETIISKSLNLTLILIQYKNAEVQERRTLKNEFKNAEI